MYISSESKESKLITHVFLGQPIISLDEYVIIRHLSDYCYFNSEAICKTKLSIPCIE